MEYTRENHWSKAPDKVLEDYLNKVLKTKELIKVDDEQLEFELLTNKTYHELFTILDSDFKGVEEFDSYWMPTAELEVIKQVVDDSEVRCTAKNIAFSHNNGKRAYYQLPNDQTDLKTGSFVPGYQFFVVVQTDKTLVEFDPSNEEILNSMLDMPELYKEPLNRLIRGLWEVADTQGTFEYEDEFMVLRTKRK